MSVFHGTVITCDSCGEKEVRADTRDRYMWHLAADQAGWIYIKSRGWICPECVELDCKEAEQEPEEPHYDDRWHQMKRT